MWAKPFLLLCLVSAVLASWLCHDLQLDPAHLCHRNSFQTVHQSIATVLSISRPPSSLLFYFSPHFFITVSPLLNSKKCPLSLTCAATCVLAFAYACALHGALLLQGRETAIHDGRTIPFHWHMCQRPPSLPLSLPIVFTTPIPPLNPPIIADRHPSFHCFRWRHEQPLA